MASAAGMVTGGAIGNAIGGSTGNRVAGTLIGAAFGGLLGNRIGAALDDENKRRAYAAGDAAGNRVLRSARGLAQPRSGRCGNVVPSPVYQVNAAPCRQYTHTVYIDGQSRPQHGTWTIVS